MAGKIKNQWKKEDAEKISRRDKEITSKRFFMLEKLSHVSETRKENI